MYLVYVHKCFFFRTYVSFLTVISILKYCLKQCMQINEKNGFNEKNYQECLQVLKNIIYSAKRCE